MKLKYVSKLYINYHTFILCLKYKTALEQEYRYFEDIFILGRVFFENTFQVSWNAFIIYICLSLHLSVLTYIPKWLQTSKTFFGVFNNMFRTEYVAQSNEKQTNKQTKNRTPLLFLRQIITEKWNWY